MRWQYLLTPAPLPWLGLLYKLPALRRSPRNAALRALCFAFFALGTALVLLLPPVYRWTTTLTGIPHLARLLAHSFGLLNGWAVQLLLLHLTHDTATARRPSRARHVVLAVVLTVMTALFLQAPIESASADFLSTYAGSPWIAAYLSVYLFYVGYSLFDIGSLSARYSRQARSAPLHLGLQLVAIGSFIGLIYPVEKTAYVLARLVTPDVPNFEAPISTAVIAVSVLLVVTGLTLPSWGAKAVVLWDAMVSYRLHRAMQPLWAALSQAYPEIVVDPLRRRPYRQSLHRRVIEVRDGLLALRPFHQPVDAVDGLTADGHREDHRHHRGHGRDRHRAWADAMAVHAALARKQANRPVGGNAAIIAAPATVDLLAEGRQLAMVSRAFARLDRADGGGRPSPAGTGAPATPDPRQVQT